MARRVLRAKRGAKRVADQIRRGGIGGVGSGTILRAGQSSD